MAIPALWRNHAKPLDERIRVNDRLWVVNGLTIAAVADYVTAIAKDDVAKIKFGRPLPETSDLRPET